jgi:hypothetical protein
MANDDHTESDTVILDFQPDEKEFGRLCGSRGREYIITAPFKSPFQYSITRAVEVHGSANFRNETLPASLLIFDVVLQTEPLSRKSRIKSIKIELEFKKNMDKADAGQAPDIVDIAPGRPPVYLSYSTEQDALTTTINASGGVNVSCANATGRWQAERVKRKDMVFWANIDGFSRPSNDSESTNYVRWLFKENTSQRSAVPTDVSLAVLLTRAEGGFLCSTTVTLEVDWVHEFFGGFLLWKTGRKVTSFQPDKTRINSKHDVTTVDASHLEKLLEDEAGLGKFAKIHMPPINSPVE